MKRIDARRLLVALAFLVMAGCERSLSEDRLNRGREVVRLALDAWQRGKTPEEMQQASPPMEVSDDDWDDGSQLIAYEITDTYGTPDDDLPRCAVTLTIKDLMGKQVSRQVVYRVRTEPNLVIGRDPFR